MQWGCHSFGHMHAIFSCHGSNSNIVTRLKIIWKALTTPGIIGFVYYPAQGLSDELENTIEKMVNYGVVHGDKNCEQHNYYRCEDEPLEDEIKAKLEQDVKFFEKRQKEIADWYDWNSKRLQLAIDATKYRLENEFKNDIELKEKK
jgi:hypothetical protein